MRELDDLTEAIIDAAMKILAISTPACWSPYTKPSWRGLSEARLHVQRQTMARFEYDGLVFGALSATFLPPRRRASASIKLVLNQHRRGQMRSADPLPDLSHLTPRNG